jgi:hypothetical protein
MPELNALLINESTKEVSIPVGATGWFIYFLDTTATLVPGTDIAIFAVGSRSGSAGGYRYASIFKKIFQIEVDAEGKYFVKVVFTNAETRGLAVGSYFWDITVVTDPALNDAGEPYVDENSDQVYPVYAVTGTLPPFIVKGGISIV